MKEMFAELKNVKKNKNRKQQAGMAVYPPDTCVRSYFYLPRVMRNISKGTSELVENARPRGVLSSVCI